MARSQFEALHVYRLAEQLADAIWDVVATWPSFAKSTMGYQLVRASDSVGANIAEGVGRATYADNRRFAIVARGSLNEVKHWLRRAVRRDLLALNQIEHLRSILDALAPMLNAYIKSIGQTRSAGV
ncbi:MAG: four helix bundle protein [Bacteroidetes bacterium]|nr:four helix bundle protein [Bacteroidota bacterium]